MVYSVNISVSHIFLWRIYIQASYMYFSVVYWQASFLFLSGILTSQFPTSLWHIYMPVSYLSNFGFLDFLQCYADLLSLKSCLLLLLQHVWHTCTTVKSLTTVKTVFNSQLFLLNIKGAAVVEWLCSWLAEQEVPGWIPGLATWILEIGYFLLPSRDMAEIPLKRRESSIQPTNQYY